MTEDKIEFVDREYGQCVRSERPRLIKARSSSYNSISKRFRDFRISYLQGKLEKMKNDALSTGYSLDDFSKKIDTKSKAIARLEEKIMVVAKEDVPDDYVSKRAIKLKKAMIENLTYNSHMLYSIGLDNKEKVFANDLINDEVSDEIVDNGQESTNISVEVDGMHEEDVNVVPEDVVGLPEISDSVSDDADVTFGDLTRQTITDVVNSELDQINIVGAAEESGEQIEEYSQNNSVIIPQNETDESVVEGGVQDISLPDSSEMSREDVRNAIESAFSKIESDDTELVGVDEDSIRGEVDDVIDRIKVSRNNANSARIDKFDENGDVRPRGGKYHYTPMTDEEIRESQRNLGFDEHGNIVDNAINSVNLNITVPKISLENVIVPKSDTSIMTTDMQVRDLPVVVDEREHSITEYGFDMESDNAMFDVIDVAGENISSDVKSSQSSVVGGDTASTTDLVEYTFTDSIDDSKSSTEESAKKVSGRLDDYLSLKDKLLRLQEQKKTTQQQKIAAEKVAEERAEKAQEVKRMFEESQRTYEDRLNMLKAYTEALEQECENNARGAKIAEDDARMSDNFIAVQQEKTDANYRVIEEIDGIINVDSEDLTSKAK